MQRALAPRTSTTGSTKRRGALALRWAMAVIASVIAIAACKTSEDTGATDTPTCGKKPLPDCPTQKWMKENLKPALDEKDQERLAKNLELVAARMPNGFTDWDKIARRGAEAARRGDIEEAKASCKTCHDELRSRFRKELRTKQIF